MNNTDESLSRDLNLAASFLGSFWQVHPQLRMMGIHRCGGAPRLFEAPDATAAVQWGAELNPQGWNIYFHVNCGTAARLSTKDRTVNVIRALHVDIDPPPVMPDGHATWLAVQAEALARLFPTYIIKSGRGLQGFWLLQSSFEVTPETWHAIRNLEALNARLAVTCLTDPSKRRQP